jgi:CubicO group peptidase (beta-lactamase class C family)
VESEIGTKLNELLSRYESYGLSGTFLVAKDGQVVLLKGYGLADREQRFPNTPDTLFEMGSITKTFTAAAILRLEMQGKLKTDDLISRYLGEFPKTCSGHSHIGAFDN